MRWGDCSGETRTAVVKALRLGRRADAATARVSLILKASAAVAIIAEASSAQVVAAQGPQGQSGVCDPFVVGGAFRAEVASGRVFRGGRELPVGTRLSLTIGVNNPRNSGKLDLIDPATSGIIDDSQADKSPDIIQINEGGEKTSTPVNEANGFKFNKQQYDVFKSVEGLALQRVRNCVDSSDVKPTRARNTSSDGSWVDTVTGFMSGLYWNYTEFVASVVPSAQMKNGPGRDYEVFHFSDRVSHLDQSKLHFLIPFILTGLGVFVRRMIGRSNREEAERSAYERDYLQQKEEEESLGVHYAPVEMPLFLRWLAQIPKLPGSIFRDLFS